MSKKQIELNRQQLEEILSYLGYPIYSEPGVLTVRAFNCITRLITRKVVEHNQLPSVIAEQWKMSATQKVRFFNIVWDTDGEVVEIPTEVLMEDVPADVDVAMEGADKLSDRYGWCVSSFEFEKVGAE